MLLYGVSAAVCTRHAGPTDTSEVLLLGSCTERDMKHVPTVPSASLSSASTCCTNPRTVSSSSAPRTTQNPASWKSASEPLMFCWSRPKARAGSGILSQCLTMRAARDNTVNVHTLTSQSETVTKGAAMPATCSVTKPEGKATTRCIG